MGKHSSEKVKMSSKKKIVIISVVVAAVIIAGLVTGYFLFLRDDGTISKSRIKEDIANSNILSQKIGDYQQEFQIADFTYSTKEEDKQTKVSAKVDLENEVYSIDDLAVNLNYTKDGDDY